MFRLGRVLLFNGGGITFQKADFLTKAGLGLTV